MTQDSFPITPPPELVNLLRSESPQGIRDAGVTRELHLITAAYRAGADQELEACCEWIYKLMDRGLEWSMDLRTARRPKPPSLKEQALDILQYPKDFWSEDEVNTIRRALEQLDD